MWLGVKIGTMSSMAISGSGTKKTKTRNDLARAAVTSRPAHATASTKRALNETLPGADASLIRHNIAQCMNGPWRGIGAASTHRIVPESRSAPSPLS